MKNLLANILLLFFAASLTSCFDDDSTLGTIDVPDIEIGELRDTIIVSYVGNILHVSPEVTTAYPESDLEYAWYIYQNVSTGTDNSLEDGFRTNKRADTKELDYEVNLSTGSYTILFEVTSITNDYSRTTSMTLTTSTSFSNGFYILKETANGDTEVDLLTPDGFLIEGLMENVLGAPISGTPLNLSLTYNHGYINPDNQEMAQTNMVHVFSQNEFHSFRTEDMLETFNNETIKFEGTDPDETFGVILEDANGILCASSNGVYRLSTGATSGRIGLPSVSGDYSNFHYQGLSYGLMGDFAWNEDEHCLYSPYFGTPYEYELPSGLTQNNLECVASSQNFTGFTDQAWYLVEDNSTNRRALLIGSMNVEVVDLDEDSHLANADIVAGIGRDATIIYAVDDNQIYLYNFNEREESSEPITLPGLPSGETISYISNQYVCIMDDWGMSVVEEQSVNYLIVATESGEGYKLYVYDNLVGGVPDSQPAEVVESSGSVKAVRYLTLYASSIGMFGYFSGGTPYPFGD